MRAKAAGAVRDRRAWFGFAETRYQAKSWNKQRRVCVRIEATATVPVVWTASGEE
jgi:hypothetical protein